MQRLALLLLALMTRPAWAGGGPASVLVLHNALGPESIEIAEYYAEARDIPPGQLCRVSGVDPAALTISYTDFEAHIQTAFRDCMDTLPNPDEIDYIVVARGLPLRVDIESGFHTSLQAMLQVGHGIRTSDGSQIAGMPQAFSGGTAYASVYNPLWPGSGGTSVYPIENGAASRYGTGSKLVTLETQPRAFSRTAVTDAGGFDLSGEMFLVSRLDGFDSLDALDLVDRAIAGDGSFPEAPITCMAAADSARGARDPECAYVVQMLDGAGIAAQWIDVHDASLSGVEMSAYLTGTTSLQGAIDGNTYVPGTFACNLTSYGAVPSNFVCDETETLCPESESQTSIARLVRGGVTGAHGTVAEPLNNSFPGAGMLLLYTMGYNMIESAQLTQAYLYWQNIYLGDPLTSPWAERPEVTLGQTEEVPVNRPLAVFADTPTGSRSCAFTSMAPGSRPSPATSSSTRSREKPATCWRSWPSRYPRTPSSPGRAGRPRRPWLVQRSKAGPRHAFDSDHLHPMSTPASPRTPRRPRPSPLRAPSRRAAPAAPRRRPHPGGPASLPSSAGAERAARPRLRPAPLIHPDRRPAQRAMQPRALPQRAFPARSPDQSLPRTLPS